MHGEMEHSTGLTVRDKKDILILMLSDIQPVQLGAAVAAQVYERATDLAEQVGARVGKPKSPPPVEVWVKEIVLYAQAGNGKVSNELVPELINKLLRILAATCYPPTTTLASTLWDRRAGEPQSEIESVLLAARARWDIETSMPVPIRWLAPLGGVSVKTARNLASEGTLRTRTISGNQVCAPEEAARWLSTRGVKIKPGWRA